MDALRNGLILFTERYEACVELYARTLALSIWFSKPELTCFRFGQSYPDDRAWWSGCRQRENPQRSRH